METSREDEDKKVIEDEERLTRISKGRDTNKVMLAHIEGFIVKWSQEVFTA